MQNKKSVYDRIKHLELGMQQIPGNVMNEGVPLGYLYNPFLKEKRLIRLELEQLAKHCFMSGETGSGKTSFFYTIAKNMINESIENPDLSSGFVYIDPVYNGANGLLTYVYKCIEEGQIIDLNKVHYFKYTSAKSLREMKEKITPLYDEQGTLVGEEIVPLDTSETIVDNLYECEHVPGHNLLDFDPIHDDVMSSVEKIMAIIDVALPSGSGGAVRMQKYIRNALGPLLLDSQSRSIVDVLRFVKEEKFRTDVLARVDKNKGHSYIEFWESSDGEIPKETLDAMETRLDGLTGSVDMRRIFGQKEESMNFVKYMDEGHIVLVDLGHIEYNGLKKMISSHIVYNFYMAAKNKRRNKRRRFVVFVDEVTQAEVDAIPAIVADGRQFGFVFFPMTQEITQLRKETQDALKRVANFFVLRQSIDGSTIMSKVVGGVLPKTFIRKLETSVVALYTKAVLDGKEKTFTCLIKADPPFIYNEQCQVVDYTDGEADAQARKFAFSWAKKHLISRDFKTIESIDKVFFNDRGIAYDRMKTSHEDIPLPEEQRPVISKSNENAASTTKISVDEEVFQPPRHADDFLNL